MFNRNKKQDRQDVYVSLLMQKFNLEGSGGDTYLLFDGTSIQVWVNGVQVWDFT